MFFTRACLPAALLACSSSGVGTGTATVRWSVDSVFDPNACAVSGATDAVVDLFFDGGGFATRAVAPCDAFGATVVLEQGYYFARVTLANPNLQAVSTTVEVPLFFVAFGRDTRIDVDFPAVSFFAAKASVGP